MMTSAAQDGGLFSDGLGAGGILLIVGMVLAVAVVSGLGFIARMNDRSAERRSARERAQRAGTDAPEVDGARTDPSRPPGDARP